MYRVARPQKRWPRQRGRVCADGRRQLQHSAERDSHDSAQALGLALVNGQGGSPGDAPRYPPAPRSRRGRDSARTEVKAKQASARPGVVAP